jgi:hypothetical protein
MRLIVVCDTEKEFDEMKESFEWLRENQGVDKLLYEHPTFISTLTLNPNGTMRHSFLSKELKLNKICNELFGCLNPINK